MSKASLRKELLTFTGEQLVEVILNAYSSSKEAKEYFEFFLNPDVDALFEKKVDIIAKELNRSKRNYSKARISRIRAAIKDFEAFGVGSEATGRLMYSAIRMLVGQYRYLNYPEALLKGTYKLVRDYIDYADSKGMTQEALEKLNSMIRETGLGTAGMREHIRIEVTVAIEALARKK